MRSFTKKDYDQLKIELEIFKTNAKFTVNNDHISIGYPARDQECENFADLISNFFEEEKIKVNRWDLIREGELPDTDILFQDAPDNSIMISIFPR
ncbi:hypothetical protein [Chryseobacterium artocarpi]|nr:hypothetical protein [Chryseobacterium artocarpi]